jgi:cAMP-dependent protein kinase regulator
MAVNKNAVNAKVQEYVKKGQWKNALEEMRKLLAEDKNDPMITLRMGDLFTKLGNKEKAAISYFRTASLFASDGQKAKAIATYKMVLRIDPDYEGVQDRLDLLAEMPAAPAAKDAKETAIRNVQAPVIDVQPTIDLSPASGMGAYSIDLDEGGYGQIDIQSGGGDGGYDPADAGIVGGAGFELDSDSSGYDSGQDGYDMSGLIDTGRADDTPGIEAGTGAGESFEPVMPDVADLPAPHPIPLFSGIPREDIIGLISRMKGNAFKKDDTIVREGEQGDSLYVVKSGTVRVVTKVKNKEVRLATLGERDFFGEVSFLTSRPRTADVVADGPAEILELKRADLQELMDRYPDVEASLRMFHENRVEDTLSSIKAIAKDMFA